MGNYDRVCHHCNAIFWSRFHLPPTQPLVTANTHDQEVTKDVDSSCSSNIVSSSKAEKEYAKKEEVKNQYQNFKSFDIVDDFSDHHYTNPGFKGHQVISVNISLLFCDLPLLLFTFLLQQLSFLSLLEVLIVWRKRCQ